MGANDECNRAGGFNNNQTARDDAKAAVTAGRWLSGNLAPCEIPCASPATMLYSSITS
jgi:hypothetical protein